jgi:hypothetical protein
MAVRPDAGKLYHLFTLLGACCALPAFIRYWEGLMVGGIAIAMFVALVGFGGNYFGWSDPDGKVQLALITAFILGIIGGFKARG